MSLQETAEKPDETTNLEPVNKDFADFRTRMAAVGLPPQLQECLINSGYDTITAVAHIKNKKQIEAFFRENHDVFVSPLQKRNIYGIFASNPEKFRLLPGQTALLSAFVQLCKALNAPERPSRRSPLRGSRLSSTSAKRRRVTPSTASAQSTNEGTLADETENGHQQDSICGELEVHDAQSPNHLDSTPSSPRTSESDSEQRCINDVYAELCRKLRKWSAAHENPSVRNLQLGREYLVSVETCESSIDGTGLIVSTICLICTTHVRMHLRGNTFTISNATRHLYNCVVTGRKHILPRVTVLPGVKEKKPKKSGNLLSGADDVVQESDECLIDVKNELSELAQGSNEHDDHNYMNTKMPSAVQCYMDDVYAKLCARLKKWSAKHKLPSVRNLQLDRHYRVCVECCESSADQTGLLVSAICLMCNTNVKMRMRGNAFTIPNVARHLKYCAIKEFESNEAGSLHGGANLVAEESVDCLVELSNEPYELAPTSLDKDGSDDEHNDNSGVILDGIPLYISY